MIVTSGLEPRLLQPNGPRRKSRFAFVIHPLSQRFFHNVEPLGTMARVSPPVVMDVVEKVLAYPPPFVYGHVTGVVSPTGAEAEGWLITVGGTPEGDPRARPRVHLRQAARRRRGGPWARAPRSWGSAPSPRSSATPG